jgi:large subunit ribosomal protein L24
VTKIYQKLYHLLRRFYKLWDKKKIHVKVGDQVKIISGSYKNEIGEVKNINKKTGKITVNNINFKFKHIKPRTENDIGEIKQFEAPIHHSNVKLST